MAVPRPRRLLDQLDAGHHAQRMRTMALLGRDHAGDPELARLLDQLASRSDYHHFLTLVAAAAGDDERLRASLTHGSLRIRLFALAKVASLDHSGESVHHALQGGSTEDRRQMRRFVNRNRRTDVAEAVIDDIRDDLGDREAAALLATCGEDTVRRLLPEIRYAVANLASLARRHPDALLGHIEAELRPLPQRQRDGVWHQIDPSLAALSLADPDRVLRLVESSVRARSFPAEPGYSSGTSSATRRGGWRRWWRRTSTSDPSDGGSRRRWAATPAGSPSPTASPSPGRSGNGRTSSSPSSAVPAERAGRGLPPGAGRTRHLQHDLGRRPPRRPPARLPSLRGQQDPRPSSGPPVRGAAARVHGPARLRGCPTHPRAGTGAGQGRRPGGRLPPAHRLRPTGADP